MASGGWGGAYSNPFAAQEAAAAAAAAEDKASAGGRQGQAYGAWSAGGTPAASAPAVPAFVAPTPAAAAAGSTVTAREAELQRREAELARREAQLAQAGASGAIKVCSREGCVSCMCCSPSSSRSSGALCSVFACSSASIWCVEKQLAPTAMVVHSAPSPPFTSTAGPHDLLLSPLTACRLHAVLLPCLAALFPPCLQNWPRCCPFIYHDIRAQIPSWNRSFVRFTYLVELITIAAFFYNAIIILATLFAGEAGLNWVGFMQGLGVGRVARTVV